jgi:predicted flap endonuclease-1-like 5' DNA nuclease
MVILIRAVVLFGIGFIAGRLSHKFQPAEATPEPVEQIITITEPEPPAPPAVPAPPVVEVEPTLAPDDLVDINGIGPVFAKRLNEAGITTFAQLAALTPEKAREITGVKEWQPNDPAAWIAEAQTRLQGK